MISPNSETRQTPPEFQDRVTDLFGTNRFGEPNFKIVWGQSEFMRMGNYWRDTYGNERREYRDVYACHGNACWVIMRWRPPEDFGTPELYFHQTWDEYSRMHITGEYPYKGRYIPLVSMHRKTLLNGRLLVEAFPLSHILIDHVLPLMIAAKNMSYWERKAADDLAREAENKKETQLAADLLEHNLPAYFGPVSFSNQGCRTSLLDRKIAAIEAAWNRMSHGGSAVPQMQRGFHQGRRPLIRHRPN